MSDTSIALQCRTYPFWPEPLTSRHDWEAEALRCEGIQTQTSLPLHHHRQHHNVAVEVAQSGLTTVQLLRWQQTLESVLSQARLLSLASVRSHSMLSVCAAEACYASDNHVVSVCLFGLSITC